MRATFDYKSTASVITNVLQIFPNCATNLQRIAELSPSSWLHRKTRSENAVVHRTLQNESAETFRNYRKNFISDRIHAVLEGTDFAQQTDISSRAPVKQQTTSDKSDNDRQEQITGKHHLQYITGLFQILHL